MFHCVKYQLGCVVGSTPVVYIVLCWDQSQYLMLLMLYPYEYQFSTIARESGTIK